jgi:hypothetical protein
LEKPRKFSRRWDTATCRPARWGEELKGAEQQPAERVQHLPSRDEIIPGEAKNRERLGVGLDGAMRYVLGEGWKEFKVGCVCEIVERPTFVKETLEWEGLGHALHNTYVAHLGGPKRIGGIGLRRGTPKCWAMGPPGSGIWPTNTFMIACTSWTGIMRPNTWPTPRTRSMASHLQVTQ